MDGKGKSPQEQSRQAFRRAGFIANSPAIFPVCGV
jgi:hypothetical protein